jgi:hypothetical protein
MFSSATQAMLTARPVPALGSHRTRVDGGLQTSHYCMRGVQGFDIKVHSKTARRARAMVDRSPGFQSSLTRLTLFPSMQTYRLRLSVSTAARACASGLQTLIASAPSVVPVPVCQCQHGFFASLISVPFWCTPCSFDARQPVQDMQMLSSEAP